MMRAARPGSALARWAADRLGGREASRGCHEAPPNPPLPRAAFGEACAAQARARTVASVWSCAPCACAIRARVRGAELDRQRLEAPQPEILAPDERLGPQLQVSQSTKQGRERDLRFHAREWRSEAEVRTPAESEMPVLGACQIGRIGIWGLGVIAIGSRHQRRSRFS